MAERVPTSPPFDTTALSDALHTDPRDTLDLAFGPGQRYALAGGQSSLEVFPKAHLSRITTATSRLELFGSPMPQVIDGNVVFRRETGHEDTSLSVSPEGTVVFGYVSSAPAPSDETSNAAGTFDGGGTSHVPVSSDCDVESAQPATAPEPAHEPAATAPASDGPAEAATSPAAPTGPVPAGSGLRPPTPRQQPRQTGRPTSQSRSTATWQQHPEPVAGGGVPATNSHTDQPTQEQQPRLQLTRRLGRDPSFRTSPRGTFIGRFPLAVHQQDGTTTWHTILAFGERAKQLQHRADAGELTKGQEVSLVGYQHTRTQPTREGGTKTVTEIYAVAVTRR